MENKEEIDYFKLIKAMNNIKELKEENKNHLKLAKGFRNAFSLTTLSGFILVGISAGVLKDKALTIFTCALSGLGLVATGAMVQIDKRIQKSNKDCDKAMKALRKIKLEKFNCNYNDDDEIEV